MEYAKQNTATPLKENSTLSDFITSIDAHISGAQDILHRIDKIADRIGGTAPRDAGQSATPESPEEPALNLRLRRKLADLGRLQAAISNELGRLESSI